MSDNKPRKLNLRSLKLIPAAAISLIVLAVLSLLGLLNFNLPSLNDSAQQKQEDAAAEQASETVSDQALVSAELLQSSNQTSEAPAQPLLPLDWVDVLIDGDDYLFATGQRDGDFVREGKTVAELVDAARSVSGDATGVKVRITRTFQATAQAEATLMAALTESGLNEDEIDQRRTLVEKSP